MLSIWTRWSPKTGVMYASMMDAITSSTTMMHTVSIMSDIMVDEFLISPSTVLSFCNSPLIRFISTLVIRSAHTADSMIAGSSNIPCGITYINIMLAGRNLNRNPITIPFVNNIKNDSIENRNPDTVMINATLKLFIRIFCISMAESLDTSFAMFFRDSISISLKMFPRKYPASIEIRKNIVVIIM